MKTTVLRYGLRGAVTICVLFLLSWFLGKNLSFSVQEILGYASMVVALSFVFFGIKHFRDRVNNGMLGFGKALQVGVLISLITALAFGILDVIYVEYINPDFSEEYYAYMVEQYKNALPEAEFKVKLTELEHQKAMFGNSFFNFVIMFLTVLLIGFIISLLSAVVLQRKAGDQKVA